MLPPGIVPVAVLFVLSFARFHRILEQLFCSCCVVYVSVEHFVAAKCLQDNGAYRKLPSRLHSIVLLLHTMCVNFVLGVAVCLCCPGFCFRAAGGRALRVVPHGIMYVSRYNGCSLVKDVDLQSGWQSGWPYYDVIGCSLCCH